MASNRVLAYSLIKSIKNGTKDLNVSYVTKTEAWERPIYGQNKKDEFVQIIQKNLTEVPANAATVALKEGEHPSPSDTEKHWTAIFKDEGGNHITTKHLKK